MKTIIAIVLTAVLTGCVHELPCPPEVGDPGELCSMLMIPTPDSPFTDTTQGIAAARHVLGSK